MVTVRSVEIQEQIGTILSKSGGSRIVYNHKTDPGLVIKEARFDSPFVNIIEYSVYDACPNSYLSWLAEPLRMSFDGKYLVMRRTLPIKKEDLPKEIPFFLSDLHLANWGLIDGKPVCHDYASFVLSSKMKEATISIDYWEPAYLVEYYEGYQAVLEKHPDRYKVEEEVPL